MFKKHLFLLSLLALLISSCEKDIGNLGMGMMPSEDKLSVHLDSLSNFNFKYLRDNTNDTIRASRYNLILGSYIDPVFGKVRAEIFAPIYFSDPVIDRTKYEFEIYAANLVMTYTDTSFMYGKNVAQNISLYQLLEPIAIADYRTLNFVPREKLLQTFSLNIDTAITSDSTISFPLSTEFISKIETYIKTGTKEETGNIYSVEVGPEEINKVFANYFYGLHFKTNFDDASIIKLKNIKIDVKIKRWNSEITDTITQEMVMADFIDKDNYIYKHPLVCFELQPTAEITENIGKSYQKKVYVQPMKGYKVDFQFPELQRWYDSSKVVINTARLTIPIEKDAKFDAIPRLVLNIYETGKNVPIYSFTSQTIEYNDQYVFYVNSFISYYLRNKKPAFNYRYEIITPNNNLYVNRSVLLTENTKLHLTYTKYK